MKADFRQINEKVDGINENSEKLENKIDNINENSKKQNEILSENLIKLMNEKFDKNKEETNENKKDKSALLSEKKPNRNNEMKTMKIRQKRQRKLMNTREGLEMIKGGLVKLHNVPITEPREVRQLRKDVYKRQGLLKENVMVSIGECMFDHFRFEATGEVFFQPNKKLSIEFEQQRMINHIK